MSPTYFDSDDLKGKAAGLLKVIYATPAAQPASTTGCLLVYNDSTGTVKTTGSFNDIEGTKRWLQEIITQNPAAKAEDFTRVDSDVEDYFTYATETLKKNLGEEYPKVLELRFTIFSMGAALEIQLARNPAMKGMSFKRSPAKVVQMMNKVRIDPTYVDHYQRMHEYYNSTKHWDEKKYSGLKSLIAGPNGRLISARYYESVRQILVGFYTSLTPPDYVAYGVTIDWNDKSLDCP
jgi:hypothetical protein